MTLDAAAVSIVTKLDDRRNHFDYRLPYIYRLDRFWGTILFLLRVCRKLFARRKAEMGWNWPLTSI